MVIDNNHTGSATTVAAGLINPVTGHRLNISEGFNDYNALAKTLYWQIERDLGCTILRNLQQTRLIKNAGQADYLEKRKTQAEYREILNNIDDTGGWFNRSADMPYGAINVSQTAVVDTKRLLHHMKAWLLERDSLRELALNYSDLQSSTATTRYTDIEAKSVVFCEGYQAINNPWLSHLPFKLAKGDILTIQPSKSISRMLSWGNWLIPNQHGGGKLGSNYVWNDTSLRISDESAEKFLLSLRKHTGLQASVLNHEVGIRPSTTQRKPFIGPLSNLPNAYCLNGLGSKGCLIAPSYVSLLCDHLLENQHIPVELTQWL